LIEKSEYNEVLQDIIKAVSISAIIFFITLYIPILGLFLALILPMPVLYYRLKLGKNMGIIIMALIFAMTIVITGSLFINILFYGCLLLTGFFLGNFIEKRLSIEKIGVYTCFFTIGVCFGVLFFYSIISNQEIGSIITSYVRTNIVLTLELYEKMGVSKNNVQLISTFTT